MSWPAKLLRHDVLPFIAAFVAWALTALLLDAALHYANAVWIGRYLGIPGVLLILSSFAYSMRKRRWIASGQPAQLLRWHERLAWAGSLLILVHAGVHFNAILGWLAVWAMLANVGSGLTGKYLLERARTRLEAARHQLREQGLSAEEAEARMVWDSLTFDVVKRWRKVHFPITLAFAVLALAHIVASLLFWSW